MYCPGYGNQNTPVARPGYWVDPLSVPTPDTDTKRGIPPVHALRCRHLGTVCGPNFDKNDQWLGTTNPW